MEKPTNSGEGGTAVHRLFPRGIIALLIIALTLSGCAQTAPQKAVPVTEPAPTETLPPETTTPVETTQETLPPETQPQKVTIDEVPLYYQSDYPYIKFGYGTMATSGCSVTCLAMIATYLLDQEYTPPQMAYHFGGYDLNHVERLDLSLELMQLPYTFTYNVRDLLTALKEGKVGIAMMNEQSFFTDEQHFIVLAGMTEDGKIIINDPYKPNYIRATTHLQDAYDNGFEEYHLVQGFTGAWIFDKADITEDTFRFDASMPEQMQSRYVGYTLSEEDTDTLIRFLMVEAGDKNAETQQAVAEVVLNRMYSPDYPYTVQKAIGQSELHRAASAMSRIPDPDPDLRAVVEAAVYGPYILPEDIFFYSAWTEGQDLWGQLEGIKFYKTR